MHKFVGVLDKYDSSDETGDMTMSNGTEEQLTHQNVRFAMNEQLLKEYTQNTFDPFEKRIQSKKDALFERDCTLNNRPYSCSRYRTGPQLATGGSQYAK